MKNKAGACFLAILALLLLLFPVAAVASSGAAPFPGHEKVSISLKNQWVEAAGKKGGMDTKVECMVKLKKGAGKAAIKRLKKAGYGVRTVLDTVITGSIRLGDLPKVAGMMDVVVVEGGVKVRFKEGG